MSVGAGGARIRGGYRQCTPVRGHRAGPARANRRTRDGHHHRVVAAIGTFSAALLGVAGTRGIGWIELAIQVALAAVGVTPLAGSRRRT